MPRKSVRLLLVIGLFAFALVGLRVTTTLALEPAAEPVAAPALQSSGFELGGQIMTFLYPNEMRSAGMTWLKMQVVWNRGGSTADAQNIIDHARRHGFKVLLSIKGNKNELAVNQTQYYQDYANFVAAVARLGPDAIEIWNEPNTDREWPAGLIHGSVYTQLLARAYPAIKAANPNVMVISGAPAPTGYFGGGCATSGCDDKIFIEQMAAAGASQYFDCTGMHYNEGVLPPSATSGDPRGNSTHYSRYYGTMVSTYRNVFPGKPLCFTELGYLTPEGLGALPPGFEWGANTSRQEQAEWLAQAAALSRDQGFVRMMVVWNVDASIYNADPMAGWSIIRNGNCLACATLAQTMGVGAPTPTPSGPETPQPGLKGQYYDNPDFTNLRVTRIDPVIDFSWDQSIPATGVGADTFSVRWTGQVVPQYSETYTFYTTSDDGVRLWVNGQQLINNWTDHAPVENSGSITLTAGQRYDIRLDYYENTLGAQIQLRWSSPSQPKQIIPQNRLFSAPQVGEPTPGPTPGSGTGLTASYFDNLDFTALRVTRVDASVNFDWGNGSPDPQVAADTFSVRWAGQVLPRYSETYTFYTTTDDGVRLWVNGQQLINNWNDYAPTENRGTIALTAGQPVDIRMEYYENGGGASARLEWSSASQTRQVIPQSQLFPAAVELPTATATATASATATATVTATASATPTTTVTSTATATATATTTPVQGSGTGLTGEYYDNRDFTNLRLTRVDRVVNFDWGNGAPDPSMDADTFSVRWRGQLIPRYSETYTIATISDDGVRLWVNGQLLINNWNDYPPTENRGTIALTAGQPVDIQLDYYENGSGALVQLIWSSPSQPRQIIPQSQLVPRPVTTTPTSTPTATVTPVVAGDGTGLTGQYFDNMDFTALRLTRVDPTIDFNWGRSAPASGIGADTFSVRWSGQVAPRFSETYTFYTYSDDGVRLWVNNQLIINDWTDHSAVERSGTIALTAGVRYDIRLEFYDNGLEAVARLSWSSASQPKQVIPRQQLYPANVVNPPAETGLRGEYYDNSNLTALLFTRTDATVNFDWGNGAPRAGMGTETFSERWTGQVIPLYSEVYTFHTISDDGVRLWVNGQLLINNWTLHAPTEDRATIALQAGQAYDLRLEHYEDGGGALIQLLWSSASQTRQIIPQSQLRPATQASAALMSAELPPASLLSAELPPEQFAGNDTTGQILPTVEDMSLGIVELPVEPIVEPSTPTPEAPAQVEPDAPLPDNASSPDTGLVALADTPTPTATPTLLPGEIVISAALCEAVVEQGGQMLTGEQALLGAQNGVPAFTGLRFCDVGVPAGARIVSAWVEFVSVYDVGDPQVVLLTIEDVGNAMPYAGGTLVSQRIATAPIHWQVERWFGGSLYRTIDFGGMLNLVLTRPDWASGNAVSVILTGLPDSAARMIWARPADARLVVSYLYDPLPPTATEPFAGQPTLTETPALSEPVPPLPDETSSDEVVAPPVEQTPEATDLPPVAPELTELSGG